MPITQAELERRALNAVKATESIVTPSGAVLFTGRAPLALDLTTVIVEAETILALAADLSAQALAKLRELQGSGLVGQ